MGNVLPGIQEINEKYERISEYLNEKSHRIWAAAETISVGWGGITVISKATGIDPKTIRKWIAELGDKKRGESNDRIRQKGGGRKKLKDTEKNLLKSLRIFSISCYPW